MPRIRSIKPDLFMDEDLGKLGSYSILLFIGLWTLADRDGKLEDRPGYIKANIFPYRGVDCNKLLDELQPRFIIRYEVAGKKYILIRNFKEHQRPHNREADSVIPNPPKDIEAQPRLVQGTTLANSNANPGNLESKPPPMERGREGRGREGNGIANPPKPKDAPSEQVRGPFNIYMDWFLKNISGMEPGNPDPTKRAAVKAGYSRFGRAARDIMAFAGNDPKKAIEGTNAIGDYFQSKGLSWTMDTIAKRLPDWMANPGEFNVNNASRRF